MKVIQVNSRECFIQAEVFFENFTIMAATIKDKKI